MPSEEEQKILEDANKEIARLNKKVERCKTAFLEAYRGVCKHLGCNGMNPSSPQFLQNMFFDLEMWDYEDSEEDEKEKENFLLRDSR